MVRVAEEWLNWDESDTGYQELSDGEIIYKVLDMLILRVKKNQRIMEMLAPPEQLVSNKDAFKVF